MALDDPAFSSALMEQRQLAAALWMGWQCTAVWMEPEPSRCTTNEELIVSPKLIISPSFLSLRTKDGCAQTDVQHKLSLKTFHLSEALKILIFCIYRYSKKKPEHMPSLGDPQIIINGLAPSHILADAQKRKTKKCNPPEAQLILENVIFALSLKLRSKNQPFWRTIYSCLPPAILLRHAILPRSWFLLLISPFSSTPDPFSLMTEGSESHSEPVGDG